jgi:hypothetical protein
MEYTSYLEAPDQFHFWTAVSTIAGALRRKVRFDQIHYRWSPNFYIILVAPPGIIAKSTTANVGISLLVELEIPLGPNALTWQKLPSALENARVDVVQPDGSFDPMCCLTFSASELGTFMDPSDRAMVDLLVDLWDSKDGAWTKATKTQGEDMVINPWLNIIACTTPSWLAQNVPRSLVGGGFTSRCLFVFGDAKRKIVAYPRKMMESNAKDYHALRTSLIEDLAQISSIKGEYVLTPAAEEWGSAWYNKHSVEQQISSDESGFAARTQCHSHKLAMVIAASQRDELLITQEDLEHATILVEEIGANLPRVFRAVHTKEDQIEVEQIFRYVQAASDKSMTKIDLYRNFRHMMSWQKFEEAITAGINSGYLELLADGNALNVRYKG